MSKPSAFSAFVNTVIERLEQNVSGSGSHKVRASLQRELLQYIAYDRQPGGLLARGLIKQSELAKHGPRAWAVASGMHARTRYKSTIAQGAKLSGALESELRQVDDLVKSLDLSPELLDGGVSPELHGSVGSFFETLVVRLDQRAIEDLLLAALESYRVPKPGKGQTYSEAYGYCFGTTRVVSLGDKHHRTEKRVNVARVVTQLRNHSSASHVIPNDKSERLHLEVAETFFSHLELVGDYHTHPYKTLAHLKSVHGWKYSDADETSMTPWVETHTHGLTHPSFSLIAAVAAGGRAGKNVSREHKNRVRYCVDGIFVILAAYRFDPGRGYGDNLELRVPGAE